MRWRFIAIGALAVAGSCRDSTGPGSVTGTYILRTADGIQVPVVLYSDDTETDELVSGEVQLNPDGTFRDITAERITVNGEVQINAVEATGTYSLARDTVTFRMVNNGQYRMRVARDSLIQDWFGIELVYTR